MGILTKGKNFFYGSRALYYNLVSIRGEFLDEALQRLQQVTSEFDVVKSTIEKREPPASGEEQDTIKEIEALLQDAASDSSYSYSELWGLISTVETLLVNLMDNETLFAHALKLQNNLYLLHEEDRNGWAALLAGIISKGSGDPSLNFKEIRRMLRALTGEVNEARRVNFMTTELKRSLMYRFMIVTVLIGVLGSLFTYLLFGDWLVLEAVIFGILGGFFSRVLAIKDFEFKPAAFPLVALYTYVQPLLGGIGALVLYLIMVSPIGPEVFNPNTFYLDSAKTQQYVTSLKETGNIAGARSVDSASVNRALLSTTRYPKSTLLLLMAFLAGFSERWLLGTLDTIVGKKLQKQETPAKSGNGPTGGKSQ